MFPALVSLMFRDWGNNPPSNEDQWGMSPSRCAWGYLDHMLSFVRQIISDAGNPPVVTPGTPTPYSREEVSDTLARLVMAQEETTETTHAELKVAIIWDSAMGHQCGTVFKAREVRINLNRPRRGTHDARVPRSLRGSPETAILQDRKDNFHTLCLCVDSTYIMNILIMRLATLVATRDYLLNGKEVWCMFPSSRKWACYSSLYECPCL
jgi:hypothetical protein